MPNLLSEEKSPYLLQHAHNPVDWHPWAEATFEKARAREKPIFLSVGYSTCHWCHVMAHESFESQPIADLLNAHFVPVKVDREERPDVDRVYMTFVQATTGGGGWPMSVWLTPDLEPIYGGTYFPPTSRWGRPGFVDILEQIARLWRDDRDRVRRSAAHVTGQLKTMVVERRAPTPVGAPTLVRGVDALAAAFDRQHGGFGGAPKFPRPSDLLLLFREFARRHDADARDMALDTLRAMARGGIHDHLGGGFHRYSVDALWRVPHFEKMLYDQAQLALAYLEAFQITGAAEFADVAADTLGYVARDLTRPGGGFYSAEDADSVPPGDAGHPGAHASEGACYLWTEAEIRELVGPDADAVIRRFGVRPGGNAVADPQGEFENRNILYAAESVEEVARATGRSPADVSRTLDDATRVLFEARARRPRPGLDDKILVAWNGLMMAAFARASRVLPASHAPRGGAMSARADAWRDPARDAARFIEATLWDPVRRQLLRRYRDGEAAIEAYADDFAGLIFGLLELFQADGDPHWLEWAIELQRAEDERFWDAAAGGWYSTTGTDPSVLVRTREDYDGAEPCASSLSVWNALTLARLTGDAEWAARVERTFGAFSAPLSQTPRALPMMLAALAASLAPTQEVVIVGRAGDEQTRAMHAALGSRYLPFAVIVPVSPDQRDRLARTLPFVGAMDVRDDRATAWVCRDFACRQPTTDVAEMLRHVSGGL
jgi:hypothetical protein